MRRVSVSESKQLQAGPGSTSHLPNNYFSFLAWPRDAPATTHSLLLLPPPSQLLLCFANFLPLVFLLLVSSSSIIHSATRSLHRLYIQHHIHAIAPLLSSPGIGVCRLTLPVTHASAPTMASSKVYLAIPRVMVAMRPRAPFPYHGWYANFPVRRCSRPRGH